MLSTPPPPRHLVPVGRPWRLRQGQQRPRGSQNREVGERPGAPLPSERPGALLTVSMSSSWGGSFSTQGRAGPPPAWGGQSGGRAVVPGQTQPGAPCTGGSGGFVQTLTCAWAPVPTSVNDLVHEPVKDQGRAPVGLSFPHLCGPSCESAPAGLEAQPRLRGLAGLPPLASHPKTGPPAVRDPAHSPASAGPAGIR